MNLYTNGCSFTVGHNHTGQKKAYQAYDYTYDLEECSDSLDPIVWPYQLEQHFRQVFNHAKSATGVGRLCRTTLEFLAHIPVEEMSEWIIILQLSQPGRMEFLVDQGLVLSTQGGVEGVNVSSAIEHDDQISVPDPVIRTYKQHSVQRVYSQISAHLSDNQQFLEQFKNLYILVSELEKKGLKYLITGMDPLCYGRGGNPLIPHVRNLWDRIPDHNIVLTMTEILKPHDWHHVYDPCGHPNELGHQYVANYILHELKTRGYLNEQ